MKEKNNTHQENERLRLIIIIAILLSLAGMFLLFATWPLLTGKIIILETKPLDSSNIIKDQYLRIDYSINTIPKISEAKPGQDIYVSLEKSSKDSWEYHSASLSRPNEFFILGKIISIDGNNMRVEYGIEQFFLEENSRMPSRTLKVEVRVSRDGKARIYDIQYIGGPIYTKNLSVSS